MNIFNFFCFFKPLLETINPGMTYLYREKLHEKRWQSRVGAEGWEVFREAVWFGLPRPSLRLCPLLPLCCQEQVTVPSSLATVLIF